MNQSKNVKLNTLYFITVVMKCYMLYVALMGGSMEDSYIKCLLMTLFKDIYFPTLLFMHMTHLTSFLWLVEVD